ncbi:hypothetical protein ACMA1I_14100 [Pontibacter sp. 13R65]|uniref:hypothetical protein n=1 Tax=Pontibacter sp. 13R65 TaxID=3127458 RepID=UPI00301CF766
MNFFELKTGYSVAAFSNFEAALTATEDFWSRGYKVVYLNEVSHVQEAEVMEYLLKYKSQQKFYYHNYHTCKANDLKLRATESLQTVLEILEKKNADKAKFVMVLASRKMVKAPAPAHLELEALPAST